MNSTSSSAQHLFSTVISVKASTHFLCSPQQSPAQSPWVRTLQLYLQQDPGQRCLPVLAQNSCTLNPALPIPWGKHNPREPGLAPPCISHGDTQPVQLCSTNMPVGRASKLGLCLAEAWGWMSSARSSHQPPVRLRVFQCVSMGTVNTFSPPLHCAAQGPWRPEINLLHIYFNTFPPSLPLALT